MRLVAAGFAIAAGVISGLAVAFWRLARTGDVDQAVMTGGGAFVGALGVAFAVLTYVHRD
ncbi:hypothetical protein GCM10010145_38370 [Streptomyces ruber]|uniref:Uncharacterized protein n=3 Tax=Streptomyces TaxID=1883 RepID=A0A918ESD5_9ACTN|nr:hypothetical protein GCM10010145_38370 [Streptomyces ruber]